MNDLGAFLCCFPNYFIGMWPSIELNIFGKRVKQEEEISLESKEALKQKAAERENKVDEFLRGQSIEEILDVLGEGETERRKDLDQRFRQL